MPTSLRDHCLRILRAGDLETKLHTAEALDDGTPGEAIDIDAPARAPALAARPGAGRLPRPDQLGDPAARTRCLARFAHHELMAVELFAWALLRWPRLDARLRHDFALTLADEQRHCRLYLARLAAHGSSPGDHAQNDYFWRQVPAIRASDAGPAAFLAAMGLTLEQANLDFTLVYRDAFAAAGDDESAHVCQRVHDDEVGHVRRAVRALRHLRGEPDDAARYRACVPFPLSAARARSRHFDAASRRRAGLDESLIAHVRDAPATSNARRSPA